MAYPHDDKKDFDPYEGFEEYDFEEPSSDSQGSGQPEPKESLFDRVVDHPIFKAMAAIGVLVVGIKTVWLISPGFDLHFRILFAFIYALGFIYLCAEMFTFTITMFSMLSVLTMFIKGFIRLTELSWTFFTFIYAIAIPVILAIGFYIYDKHHMKCEKCGRWLDESNLMDEETVSIYRCPNCMHLSHIRWDK